VLSYVKTHGGGTIAVSSQSSAATAITQSGAQVAGIGGFSGRESSVTVSWLAQEVRAGRIRWVLGSAQGATGGPTLPGDTRSGSTSALAAAAKVCTAVSLPSSSTTSSAASATGGAGAQTLYDCSGRAGTLQVLAASGARAS
jgi:hypothetical protein